ncbi:MAG: hypothetical protein DRJ35_04495 [Thermoprotei archaeon]|nr:MAG: hypothetical protein DRJ35_04495 [Thermoprotei archaeon]
MSRKTQYFLAAFGASASWALGVVLIKFLSAEYTVNQQNFIRYFFAGLFLSIVYRLSRSENPYNVERFKRALLPSVAAFFFQLLATTGVYMTKASLAAFMLRLNVVVLAVLVFIVYRDERRIISDPLFILSLALGLIGVYGLTMKGGVEGFSIDIGVVLVGIAACMWAVFTVLIKFFLRNEDPLAYSSAVYLMAGMMFLPLALFDSIGHGFQSDVLVLGMLLLSGIISIGLGNWFNMVSVKGLGAMLPAMLQMITPFLTVVYSYILLGERLSGTELLFGVLIIISSLISLKYAVRD